MRITVFALTFVALSLALPIASAQSVIKFSAEWERDTFTLPDSGRGDVPLIVRASIAGTVCAQEQTYSVDVKLASFEKWGGSSMMPTTAMFRVPQGAIGSEQTLPEQGLLLNLAWNLDDAPRRGAMQDYVALIRPDEVSKSGGPCLPDPKIETTDSEALRVMLEDRLEKDIVVDCLDDPTQPKCVTTSAPPKNPTPGLGAGTVALLFAVASALHTRRRRR